MMTFFVCFSQLTYVQQVQLRVAGVLLEQFSIGLPHHHQCLLYWKSKYVATQVYCLSQEKMLKM